MKTPKQSLAKIGLLCATALALGCACSTVDAQSFTSIKSFGILTNVSGFQPNAPLVQGPDGTLYGTTVIGEGNVRGTVFRIQPDGSGFTVLKWFTNELEGAEPRAGLVLSESTLYGVTSLGGPFGGGTVFKLNTNGMDFAVLKEFAFPGSDGAEPRVGLTLSGSVLYGTTSRGGSNNFGTIFKINTDGTSFTVLKDYTGGDGSNPYNVTALGNVLYGTTYAGGSTDNGTIFRLNTDGTAYTVLKDFAGTNGSGPNALTLAGNVLYGSAIVGGASGNGAVFKLNTDGTGFTLLKEFSPVDSGTLTNSDGSQPGPLTLSGGVLYGATFFGGELATGTIFKLNTDGTGFSVLMDYGGNDGYGAFGLLVSNSTLYGATQIGGVQGGGTLFKLNTDGTDYAVIKEFKGDADGKQPAGLTRSGGDLYGVTVEGGTNRTGTVFKLNIAGTGYTVLKEIGELTIDPSSGVYTNGEGFELVAVVADGGVLYGTARRGGSFGSGTVFKMNTDGTGFVVLKNFSALTGTTNIDGAFPFAGVTLSDGILYGTTFEGGSSGLGTVFKMQTNGADFTVLKHFSFADGNLPSGALVVSGNVLYGTARLAGSAGNGTVFKLNTDGTAFTVLKHFLGSDGAEPYAGLTLSGSVLYGTTTYGGSSNDGTIFKLNTDGTGFAVLKHFAGSDGSRPFGGLTLSGSALYGTTWSGGLTDYGTIFRIDTNGSNYRVLKSLNYFDLNNTMGLHPKNRMIFLDGALYGTASEGGVWNKGMVFKLDLSIPLNIQSVNNTAVLSWNDPWFSLQSAPSPTSTYTNIPGATSPYTNAIVAPRQFCGIL